MATLAAANLIANPPAAAPTSASGSSTSAAPNAPDTGFAAMLADGTGEVAPPQTTAFSSETTTKAAMPSAGAQPSGKQPATTQPATPNVAGKSAPNAKAKTALAAAAAKETVAQPLPANIVQQAATALGKAPDPGTNDKSAKPKSAKDQKSTATAQAATSAVTMPVAVAAPVPLATNAPAAPSAPAPGNGSAQAVRPANDGVTARTDAPHAQPDTQANAKQIALTQGGNGQSLAADPGNAATAMQLASATPAAAQSGAAQPANATPSDLQAAAQTAAAAVPAHPAQHVAKPAQPQAVQSASAAPATTPAAASASGGQNAGAQDQGSGNRNGQSQTAQHQVVQSPNAPVKPAPHVAIQTASTQATSTPPQDSIAQLAQGATLSVPAALQIAPQAPVHRNAANSSADQAVPLNDLSALAVTIAQKSQAGVNQFDISLHPAELGSIHVQLTVDHSGIAQAHLTAANPQTLALLQNDSSSLQRTLSDAGLNLSNSGLSFSLQGQERQNGQSNQGSFAGGRARALSVSAVASVSAANANYSLAPDGVRLDIRV